MLHTLVSSKDAAVQDMPLTNEYAMVSERIGARFISMCMDSNTRQRAKVNSTIIKDTGKRSFYVYKQ